VSPIFDTDINFFIAAYSVPDRTRRTTDGLRSVIQSHGNRGAHAGFQARAQPLPTLVGGTLMKISGLTLLVLGLVSAPLALPQSVPPRKYHPGHYTIMVRHADTQKLMTTALQPGMVGIAKRYTWRSLEPTQDGYDFSAIKSDLAWAAANGMHLIAVIEYKTFVNEKAGPAYLDNLEARNKSGGYTLALWNPTVMNRYNALVKALGAQVDGDPWFEGIATQETALSLDTATRQSLGYSPEVYRDALINILSSACASLPTSRVFWYMNFLVGHQSYLGAVASAVSSLGVVMGGPDVWPDNKSLQNLTYPLYSQFFGTMPMFGQVEDVNYRLPHMTSGYGTNDWTMPELFDFAINTMHANYILWARVTARANADAYDWYDALPVTAANPVF
jgi:hypothetical protein